MAIWLSKVTPEDLNRLIKGTLTEFLGIRFTEIGDDYIVGRMMIQPRIMQERGLLHGGASLAFAETLVSEAANLLVDHSKEFCLCLDLNANHVGTASSGELIGKATPVHIGRSTQVWEARISCGDRLISVSRATMFVLKAHAGASASSAHPS